MTAAYGPDPSLGASPDPSQPRTPASTPLSTPASTPTGSTGSRNVLGLVSMFVGIIALIIESILSLVQVFVFSGTGFGFAYFEAFGWLQAATTITLGLAALVTGVIALLRRGYARGAAAAGTAIGATMLIGLANGLLFGALYPLLNG